MTKLRRKIKEMAKKRAHRKTVQKKKADRVAKDLEKQKEKDDQRVETMMAEAERRHELGLADDEELPDDGTQPSSAAAESGAKSAKQLVGGLVVERASGGKANKKVKPLSRKQRTRKEKNREKGQAISDTMERKWTMKKIRVKTRAQVRNRDLN